MRCTHGSAPNTVWCVVGEGVTHEDVMGKREKGMADE